MTKLREIEIRISKKIIFGEIFLNTYEPNGSNINMEKSKTRLHLRNNIMILPWHNLNRDIKTNVIVIGCTINTNNGF